MYRQREIDFKPEEVIDYLRKSQSDDPLLTVEEVLAKHELILDRLAENLLGAKIPEENKFREVVSGETIKERPEINKVLKMIESPKYKAVMVVEPQRLSRGDLEDIGRMMKLFKYTDTIIITETRIYDLRDEDDWERLERELKRGNEYLEYYKKIQSRGKLLSVSQGNYISSYPPYGFDKCYVMDGKKKCPTLKENEAEADVVRLIYDLYVNHNMGRRKIANHLDSLHIKPPRGKEWSPSGIKEILGNLHHIGKVYWNWRKTQMIVEDGEIRKTRPVAKIGEYLVFEGKHDGIVDPELFQAAKDKLGKNPRVKSKAKIRNPFAGMMYCKCGKAMVLKFYKHSDGTEKARPRLMCSYQGNCNTGSCLYDEIVEEVANVLEQCIEDFEVRINNNEGDSVKLHANLIKNLEKKKEELEERELAQWEAQSHPDESQRMPPSIFKKLNEKLLKEKEEVRQALCKAYESMPEPVDYEEKLAHFRDALEALRDNDVPADKKNALLRLCIDRIEYSRDRPDRLPVKNTKLNKAWSEPPIELDIKLRV